MPASLYIHAFSITGSIFASGASQALNYFALPAVLLAPTPSLKARQFVAAHWLGHITIPLTFIPCGLMHFYLAYNDATANSRLETIAGAITISIFPLSVVFIEKLYLYIYTLRGKKDEEIEADLKNKGEGDLDTLIVRWQRWNTLRAALPFIGAMVSWWNLLEDVRQ
ncbi:hypothetical protein EJ05DRAFT_326375 [Pseudovirgaria hyperparasitica]|uniref:DUF1772-domain-containing protein n=1 Tax=Pseudovirgaria hyperparasitica TaxID=470096 RepID=A0A6A6WAQ9_9PEZI|nr:uncharacterized protein EJ05DRAFT_326375 [Pseudovirgaria hyperparasitica]KAF2758916.1 hypothetical protein EJ05DRAFT_326375 [Pseudovirgaria hyperparasitica]